MAKLHFRYGAMNAGKTTIMLQTAYNYEERNQKVLIIKPSIDTKGNEKVVSRIGLSRDVDALISPDDSIFDRIGNCLDITNCILVDEAQFLSKSQVDELYYISLMAFKEVYDYWNYQMP